MVNDKAENDLKVQSASYLISLAPPCQLLEVVNDVRVLANNNADILSKFPKSMLDHYIEQFHQVQLPGSDNKTILSKHGHLGKGVFICPRTHSKFTFNPEKNEVCNVEKANPDNSNNGSADFEDWRLQLEKLFTEYIKKHFKDGCISVYANVVGDHTKLIICVESHYVKNEMSGRWRCEYTIDLPKHPAGSELTVNGWIKVQTHLYEEGNVQLISSKDINFKLKAVNAEKFSSELLEKIQHEEDIYQVAISENFKAMSENIFKTLRRQLPVTKSKLDWNNIVKYQIGDEISKSTV